MKKFVVGVIAIPILIGLLYALPHILNFVVWLIEIDNTDFGFPLWLDITISCVTGIIAYALVGKLFDLIDCYDSESMSKAKTVIGIILGFIVSCVVHVFLQYWYIIVSIVAVALVATIVVYIFMKQKKIKEE